MGLGLPGMVSDSQETCSRQPAATLCWAQFFPQEVPRKEVSEAHRTLGIRLDPSVSFKYETAYLKKVADNIARQLQRDSLTKEETRVAYRSMYLPKVGYSAGVASLTQQQCHQVEQRAVQAFLGSLGYNANMPRVVVQAPESISGIGLTSLYNEQGIEHVNTLGKLCEEADLGFDNWSNATRFFQSNIHPKVMEYYDQTVFGKLEKKSFLVAIAARRDENVLEVLKNWEIITLQKFSGLEWLY